MTIHGGRSDRSGLRMRQDSEIERSLRTRVLLHSRATRAAVVVALVAAAVVLVAWETFFAHEFADLWIGPPTAGAVVCVAVAGAIDEDGRLSVSVRALARAVGYLLVVFAVVATAYFIWFAMSYSD